MSKTIKKLEKENLALQKKCENSDVTLIELVDEVLIMTMHLKVTDCKFYNTCIFSILFYTDQMHSDDSQLSICDVN